MKRFFVILLLFLFIINVNAEDVYVNWDSEIGGSSEKSLYNFLSNQGIDLTNINKIVFNDINSTGITYESNNYIDISGQQNNSVIAFIIDDILYIQFNGLLSLNSNSSFLFYANNNSFVNVNEIEGLEFLSTNSVSNASYMFSGLENVEELNINNWNTSNMTQIQFMFNNMTKLKNLNLSSWNTSKITNMIKVFNGFNNMENLNVDGWDLKKIKTNDDIDNYSPFSNLKATNVVATNLHLPTILVRFVKNSEIGNFRIGSNSDSNVTSMWIMFQDSSINKIDFDNFNTNNVTTMQGTFYNCNIGTITNINTSNVTNMSSMFKNSKIESFDFENLNTQNVTDMSQMFYGFSGTDNLDLSNWNVSKVTDMSAMFSGTSIKSLNLNELDTSNVTNMSGMFSNSKKLENLNILGINTSNVTNMSGMFSGCYLLNKLDLRNFDTSKVTDMSNMFSYMKSINKIGYDSNYNLVFGENFDTSKVTNMKYIFSSMDNLELLDVTGWNISNLLTTESYYSPFYGIQVTKIIANNIVLPTDVHALFANINNLRTLEISNVDTSNITNMREMFKGCMNLINIDLTGFDTSKVTDMRAMFYNCRRLTTLDLSNFDPSKVVNINGMFENMYNIKSIYVSNKWNLSSLNSNVSIFYNDENLVGSSGTKYENKLSHSNYAKIDEYNNPGLLSIRYSISSSKYDLNSDVIFANVDEVSVEDFVVENVNAVIEDNYINFYYFDKLVRSIEIMPYTNYSEIPNISISLKGNNNSVTINWEKNEYAVGYNVYRSTDGKKWAKIGTTLNNYYANNSLEYNKKYYYKINAYNNVAVSNYSNVVSLTIKPNKVSNLRVYSIGEKNIKITWDKVSVTGYEVYMGNKKIATIKKNGTITYNKTKLKVNAVYSFKVRAYKTVKGKKIYGPFSNVLTTRTTPVKPKAAIVVNDYNSLKFWFGSVKGASKFIVQNSLDGKTYTTIEEITKNGTYIFNDLEFNKVYYYRVRACNNYNTCSGWVNVSKKQTTKVPGFSLKTSSKRVTINISAVNEADGYEVFRSTYKNKKYSKVGTLTNLENLVLLNGTKKGKTYYYKVRSYKIIDGVKVYSDLSGYKKIKSK